jgi:hypothetical protein
MLDNSINLIFLASDFIIVSHAPSIKHEIGIAKGERLLIATKGKRVLIANHMYQR